MTLERALSQPIRQVNRPEFAIEYDGKMYASKRQLSREIGISTGCIHEMMVNNDLDFETAVDILLETKDRIGIPREKMISGLPVCIIDGRTYIRECWKHSVRCKKRQKSAMWWTGRQRPAMNC